MAETDNIQGMHQFLLYRIYGEKSDAVKIAQQTSHSVSSSRDVETTATKDGTKRMLGNIEQEIEADVLLSRTQDVDNLKEAQEQGKRVELWDINSMIKNEDGKFGATYYQGYVSEISAEAPTDEGVEVSITFAIEGYGKRGYTSLSEAQEKVLDYAFTEANEAPKEFEEDEDSGAFEPGTGIE